MICLGGNFTRDISPGNPLSACVSIIKVIHVSSVLTSLAERWQAALQLFEAMTEDRGQLNLGSGLGRAMHFLLDDR